MEIRPDRKLYTKRWLVLLSVSFWIVVCAGVLRLLIPFGDADPEEVAAFLWPITIATIGLMWILAVPIIILWIRNLSYFIGDDRITIHRGILTKIQQNVPYRAITDFMVHRSLFDRLLGIGTIRIQTAGQSTAQAGYEGQLAGLLEWDALHERLRAKVKTLPTVSTASGVPDTVSADGPGAGVQGQILEELRAIRRALERR